MSTHSAPSTYKRDPSSLVSLKLTLCVAVDVMVPIQRTAKLSAWIPLWKLPFITPLLTAYSVSMAAAPENVIAPSDAGGVARL